MHKWFDLLNDPLSPVSYLDEKFFYTTNRRRKVNKIPCAHHESKCAAYVHVPKIRSRRFPVKAMFLDVVARPRLDKGFDGKIDLRRVSEMKSRKKSATNQNFMHDAVINSYLKNGVS